MPLDKEQAIQEGLRCSSAAFDGSEFSIPDNPFPGGHELGVAEARPFAEA